LPVTLKNEMSFSTYIRAQLGGGYARVSLTRTLRSLQFTQAAWVLFPVRTRTADPLALNGGRGLESMVDHPDANMHIGKEGDKHWKGTKPEGLTPYRAGIYGHMDKYEAAMPLVNLWTSHWDESAIRPTSGPSCHFLLVLDSCIRGQMIHFHYLMMG
jgi:hypothetical protein